MMKCPRCGARLIDVTFVSDRAAQWRHGPPVGAPCHGPDLVVDDQMLGDANVGEEKGDRAMNRAYRALLVAAHEVLSEVDVPFMLAHPSEELSERVRRNRLIALVTAIDAIGALHGDSAR